MKYCAADFEAVIAPQRAALDASESTAYAVRDDLSVAYANPAWFEFAAANGAVESVLHPERYANVLDACAGPVRAFYEELFRTALDEQRVVEHEYACPSGTLYRRFRMRVQPLGAGLLIVHHLKVQAAHETPAHAWSESTYRADSGVITQCCHCRTTQRAADASTWDWVPELVDVVRMDISHGLCPLCLRHYYPESAARRDGLHREPDQDRT